MTFTALVLAGSRGASDPVAAAAGMAQKCLVPAAGQPMLCRVLDTLLRSDSVGRIYVTLQHPEQIAGDPELRRRLDGGRVVLLAGDRTPSLSVKAALAEILEPYPLLVTTADHPLLTPEIVDHFTRAATATGADVAAGVTSSSVLLATSTSATAAMLGSASPRNPSVAISSKSRTSSIFEVA